MSDLAARLLYKLGLFNEPVLVKLLYHISLAFPIMQVSIVAVTYTIGPWI